MTLLVLCTENTMGFLLILGKATEKEIEHITELTFSQNLELWVNYLSSYVRIRNVITYKNIPLFYVFMYYVCTKNAIS